MDTIFYLIFYLTQCTGIYLIIYGLRTLLPESRMPEAIFHENHLFEEFVFQHTGKPIYMALGYSTFFTPLIGCWAIILNRTRVLMIVRNFLLY